MVRWSVGAVARPVYELPSAVATGWEYVMSELDGSGLEGHVPFDSQQAPGGVIVYYADGDEEIIYANQYVVDLFECDSVEDFLEFVGGSFRTFVYDEDIDAVEDSIWEQVDKQGGFDRICYRIKTKTGRVISVEDFGRLERSNEGRRPVFYVFVSEIRHSGPVDWLTGLPSAERFHKMADMGAELIVSRGGKPVAIALDLASIRAVYAESGREEGDSLICLFADLLRKHFGNEACSRYADGHFYAFSPEEGVNEKLEALLADFEKASGDKSTPIRVGAYACNPDEEISIVGLGRAMVACDSIDSKWQSEVAWFSDEMNVESSLRAYVLNNIDAAIENGWIRPYYQAVVRAATGEVCGEEALARWVDPERGLLPPIEFIPVLEAAGLLHKLDMFMVDCVIRDFSIKWAQGVPVVPVSVNVSLRDVGKVNLAETIAGKTDEAGIPRELLRVEFTESAASDNPDVFREQVRLLHDAGFEVWMDDFGSGYSSLNTLKDFDFDLMKLDMGFIADSDNDKARDIVAGVIAIAHSIGAGTLAEGVETEEQALFLESIGCSMLQGYYYTKPLPLETLMKHFLDGPGMKRESFDETAYWNAIGDFDLNSPTFSSEGEAVDGSPIPELPAGIVERRNGAWYFVRANSSLREFLDRNDMLSIDRSRLKSNEAESGLGDDFFLAVERCRETGAWERIAGRREYGTGFQFYLRHLASTPAADAFAITSVPTMLGTALGTYGDVPVAYAVFRAVLNEAEDEVVDTVYVYANPLYCEWLDVEPNSLTGRSFLSAVESADSLWFSYCYEAVVEGRTMHDVVYSPELNHWLSFSISPSPVKGCCVYAFMQVDKEHREQEEAEVGRDTSDLIIKIASLLNGDDDYDTAMTNALELMSRIIHPERLYVFERGETTTSNTFEWCAEGVEPEIDTLQNMDNSEFNTWGELLAEDSVVLIPDVAAFKDIDEQMYLTLERQGITHLLAVPFYSEGELIGYLGADNYAFEERLDTRRLLEMVAAFMSARIANQRLVDALVWMGLHDSLTGLLNRRGIDQVVLQFMDENPGAPFVLALMDVDDFKGFNDRYGHAAGDAVLSQVSQAVIRAFPEEAILGRNGGDELLAMFVGDDVARADELIEAFSASELVCVHEGRSYPVTMSIGYVSYPDQAPELRLAYTRADKALYEVKRQGKDGCKRYLPSMG